MHCVAPSVGHAVGHIAMSVLGTLAVPRVIVSVVVAPLLSVTDP
ncbi:MAG: hypothetical protein ACXVDD_09535 [Polyangia bacterium]